MNNESETKRKKSAYFLIDSVTYVEMEEVIIQRKLLIDCENQVKRETKANQESKAKDILDILTRP